MNRYGSGGPSKATSTTLCQKCLKRGHFSYECTASQQDRPYISRPSRTQQLANPKLAPKITNSAPVETPKVSASSIIKSSAAARGRKRSFDDVDSPHKRSPSASSHSSIDSISTISTNRSRSRSPPPRRDTAARSHRGGARERSRSRSRSPGRKHVSKPVTRPRSGDRDFDREGSRAGSRRSRSPPRRRHRRSPSPERPRRREPQRSRSRSPYRRSSAAYEQRAPPPPPQTERPPPAQRERSLSPFSKRQALTRAQNGG